MTSAKESAVDCSGIAAGLNERVALDCDLVVEAGTGAECGAGTGSAGCCARLPSFQSRERQIAIKGGEAHGETGSTTDRASVVRKAEKATGVCRAAGKLVVVGDVGIRPRGR